MKVEFANNDLRQRWEHQPLRRRAWVDVVAAKYLQRVGQLQEASGLSAISSLRSLRVHPLKGGRAGQFTMILHDRWRLVFSMVDSETVRVEEVSNHYDD
jgi:plasmid maintenance system killer protein